MTAPHALRGSCAARERALCPDAEAVGDGRLRGGACVGHQPPVVGVGALELEVDALAKEERAVVEQSRCQRAARFTEDAGELHRAACEEVRRQHAGRGDGEESGGRLPLAAPAEGLDFDERV